MKYFYLLFLGMALSLSSSAASFDCQKAQSEVEKIICSNKGLSNADEYLSSLYSKVKTQVKHPEILTKNQMEWLKKRDKCGSDIMCLRNNYEGRYFQLNHWPETEINLAGVDTVCASGSGNEMANCYAEHYDRLKSVMKNIIEEISVTISSQEYVEKARKSQELWDSYAQYYCESLISLNGGWGGMQRNSCLVKHAKSRIEELDRLNCYENGCPQRKE